jgi:DNA polymerase I-like protein with 3'-5' exonuclease and polymerase domains
VNDLDRYKGIAKLRKKFKPVNYSAIYGVGAKKLSRTTGMSVQEAQKLLDAYWDRNWGIKKFSEDVLKTVRTIDGDMWIKNPVSGFYHSLRFEKDAFSTINQSTGVYCFDNWLAFYLTKRPNIIGQFHDESINTVRKGDEAIHEKVLRWAIGKVNDKLKLNIDLDVDVKFGNRYSDIH